MDTVVIMPALSAVAVAAAVSVRSALREQRPAVAVATQVAYRQRQHAQATVLLVALMQHPTQLSTVVAAAVGILQFLQIALEDAVCTAALVVAVARALPPQQ